MSNPKIDSEGNKRWFNSKGQYHRLDGPAREWADGTKGWWVDGKIHRLDGPAWEGVNGSKGWWVDGKLHRLDGPALEGADGSKEWWVDDIRVVNTKNYANAVAAYKKKASKSLKEVKDKETIGTLLKDLEDLDRERQDILGRIKYLIGL